MDLKFVIVIMQLINQAKLLFMELGQMCHSNITMQGNLGDVPFKYNNAF